MKKNKRVYNWISYVIFAIYSLIILFTIILVIRIGVVLYSIIPPDKSFDKNEWLTNSEERIFMVDDMLSDYNNLEGMTKDEVIAILGEDYGEDYMEEYSDENHLSYYLGYGGGFAMDPSTLEISFENGVVSDVYYYEH